MVMLFAKDVVAVEDDFVNLLDHIPGTKAEKQAYFQSRGIRVPRTTYDLMWEILTQRLHHSGAAQIVFECLQSSMPPRLRELLRIAARGKAVDLRVNEPAIVWDLFFQNGHLRRVGELFLEHRPAGRGRAVRPVVAAAAIQTGKPYEIALSFAGEDRAFVEAVANDLRARGVKVFYDAFEQVDLLGKDLAAHFAAIYKERAHYCAMFISIHYVRKAWPQFERQHAQSRALAEKREYILPIRLDNSEVPGLPTTIGYLDARTKSPKEVAAILFDKARRLT